MKRPPLLLLALVLVAGTTACSSSDAAITPGVAIGPNGITPPRLAPVRGWMSPDVKARTSLLYVSDASDDLVDVFSVPGYKLKGQITDGIDDPEGLAIDQKGKLYVSNYESGTVTVYKPGATSPALTLGGLTDPDDVVVQKDGYVFVSDYYGDSIAVFAPGKTSAKTHLTDAYVKLIFGLGIDSHDNVYLTGWGAQYSYSPLVLEFVKGKGGLVDLDLNGMYIPSGVLVDPKGDVIESDFGRDVVNIYAVGQKSPTSTISTIEPDRSAFNDKEDLIYIPSGQEDDVEVAHYPSGSLGPSISIGGFAAGAAVFPASKP
ncbi:MAG TPA: hypothetical protein VGX91_05485 [Candidatus Cybelea sp.]|nr:hypothetical protein [Candidatus Cybelea sp.]